ncbi:sodium-independent sulfate anion transporter isoform X2 [Hyaena hyaena]|uniref:sodium-independent sulfate anion transporter isoform X2 n=1 Tax=Hyaena hyaena TaxID=95912 RepID=UPI0019220015|nr:sodium-independent sulfate anion transporter isoform X2 [Hyaena hyaena]
MPSSVKALGQTRPSGASMAPQARCCSPAALQRRLPVLAWLPDYSVEWLKMDFIAGLSVGLTVIPQALAYAEVAGLPPQYGLYSAFMGCFVYFLLGTSRDVTLGPTAIMSLLVSFYTFHEPAYAVLLAFLSGCIQLAMGFLRLGFLLDFISCPVIKGFTSAATITIGFGQIKNLLGLQGTPRQFFLQVYHTFRSIGDTRVGDAVLGLVCMVLLLVLKLMRDHVPPVHPEMPPGVRLSHGLVWTATTARNALVVSFAALVAYSFEVTGYQPFVLTGQTAEGLPPVRLPPFSVTTANGTVSFSELVQDMGAGLAVVPLMGLLESIAVAKSFASQNNYRIDANQELLSIGLTNVLGSFVSSYPVTGSFGRSAGAAVAGLPDLAVLLHPQVRPGRRHHHGRGPAVRHRGLRDALACQEAGPAAPQRDLPAVLLGGAVRHPGRGPALRPASPALRGQTQHAGVRGPGAGPAAGQRPALPSHRSRPGGDTEPGSGSVAPALRGAGLYPRLQHRLHRGAGARGPPGGLPQARRHPRLRRPAGARSPRPAVCRPEGRPALLHAGRRREVPEAGARDPALQHQRRFCSGTQGGPAEGLIGALMGV